MLILLYLLTLHFVGDFLLQSDWMALNKSKNWRALLWHTGVYSIVFLPFYHINFVIVTMLLHTLQDAVTSRITRRLWFFEPNYPGFNEWHYVDGRRHWFFVMIGLDQLIHFWLLGIVWVWLG